MKKYICMLLILWPLLSLAATSTSTIILQACNDAIKVIDNDYVPTNYYMAGAQIRGLGLCFGYVSAITDSFSGTAFCPPADNNYEQNVRIITKYLNAYQEEMNKFPAILMIQSLKQAFPCKRQQVNG